MHEFVRDGNWFDRLYAVRMDGRFPTFKAALNLHAQRGGKVIVETGCVRQKDDFGAGYSTVLFADYLTHYGGTLHTVDISARNIATAQRLLAPWPDAHIVLNVMDSVKYLQDFPHQIDLLYLDSFDYPFGELLNLYGGRDDLAKAIEHVKELGHAEIVKRHGDLIGPCQDHCLQEILAAMPRLHEKSVVLIDDNNLAGEGKPRLAKDYLSQQGWHCILDWQQTLWIRS